MKMKNAKERGGKRFKNVTSTVFVAPGDGDRKKTQIRGRSPVRKGRGNRFSEGEGDSKI